MVLRRRIFLTAAFLLLGLIVAVGFGATDIDWRLPNQYPEAESEFEGEFLRNCPRRGQYGCIRGGRKKDLNLFSPSPL